MLMVLFAYAFISNVALSVMPHEPVVIWYGGHVGIMTTALVATAGTVGAAWVDHRAFGRLVGKLSARSERSPMCFTWARSRFATAPFAVIALSGLTPLPFFPFKALAFAERYPLGRYMAAVAAGRLPRYVLLAWLGYQLSLPAWPFVAFTVLLLLPTLKRHLWPRQKENSSSGSPPPNAGFSSGSPADSPGA